MTRLIHGTIAMIFVTLFTGIAALAQAQSEFPPPQGKGRIVVVVSGKSGAAHYEPPGEADRSTWLRRHTA